MDLFAKEDIVRQVLHGLGDVHKTAPKDRIWRNFDIHNSRVHDGRRNEPRSPIVTKVLGEKKGTDLKKMKAPRVWNFASGQTSFLQRVSQADGLVSDRYIHCFAHVCTDLAEHSTTH